MSSAQVSLASNWVWFVSIGSATYSDAQPTLMFVLPAQPGALGEGQFMPRPKMRVPSLFSLLTLASSCTDGPNHFDTASPKAERLVFGRMSDPVPGPPAR